MPCWLYYLDWVYNFRNKHHTWVKERPIYICMYTYINQKNRIFFPCGHPLINPKKGNPIQVKSLTPKRSKIWEWRKQEKEKRNYLGAEKRRVSVYGSRISESKNGFVNGDLGKWLLISKYILVTRNWSKLHRQKHKHKNLNHSLL